MIRYRINKDAIDSEPVPINAPPTFLLGVRPCDAKSFEVMDRHFLGGGIVDPYWKDKRDKTTVIGYAFDIEQPPAREDFYGTLGISAADTEGSDVFMVKQGVYMLLKGITPKGEQLLADVRILEEAGGGDEKSFGE